MDKEEKAKRLRQQALQHLASQGQRIGDNFRSKSYLDEKSADNTLHLQLLQNAKENQLKQSILKQQNEFRSSQESKYKDELPENWQKVLDSTTNKYYYWNTITNETSWDAPQPEKKAALKIDSNELENNFSSDVNLPDGWERRSHPATKQVYYYNTITKQSCGTLPTKGGENTITSSLSDGKVISNERKDLQQPNNKKRKFDLDSLDPTNTKMTWRDGMALDGKMADSTASGELWQQRPYPAPGSVVRKRNDLNGSVGPSRS